jgi:hypothetical protein
MPVRILTLFLGFSLFVSLVACRQVPAPDETPAGSAAAFSESSTYTVVLQGYEDGAVRRDFQKQMEALGLDVELLQAGGNRAEYRISMTSESKTDWLSSLSQALEAQYELLKEDGRLTFTRR